MYLYTSRVLLYPWRRCQCNSFIGLFLWPQYITVFSCIPLDNNAKHAAPLWSMRHKQEAQTNDRNKGTEWLQGTGSTDSLKYMHTSFNSSMNVFLVLGLSRSVKASMSLATPPSDPDDSTTIPDSSREIFKSVWRKQFKWKYSSECPFCHFPKQDSCCRGFVTYKVCSNLQFSLSVTHSSTYFAYGRVLKCSKFLVDVDFQCDKAPCSGTPSTINTHNL